MISLALVILAAIANSVMDTLKFRFKRSVFNRPGTWLYKYSEPQSWRRKWKNGTSSFGEAFFLSSTVLVWTTDLWHLAQMAMKLAFIAAIIFYKPLFTWYFDLMIYSIVFSLVFETFFSTILIWKKR